MKTLDEVIKAWEICHSDIGDCDECPYHDNCERKIDDDLFHYLKAYQQLSGALTSENAEIRQNGIFCKVCGARLDKDFDENAE